MTPENHGYASPADHEGADRPLGDLRPQRCGCPPNLIANAASVHGTTISHRGPPSNAYRDESLTIPQGVRMVPLDTGRTVLFNN